MISYSPFTLKTIHNLHHVLSKFVNACTVTYLSSDRFRTGGYRREEKCLMNSERGISDVVIPCSALSSVLGSCQESICRFKAVNELDGTEYYKN